MSARLLLSTLIFFIISSSVIAQSVSISGKVTDADNGEPLIGATVVVVNSSQGSVTDLDGKYAISNLPAGTYSLKTSYVGYVGKEISGVEVNNGQVITLNITMSVAKANTLIEVIVITEARKENIAS